VQAVVAFLDNRSECIILFLVLYVKYGHITTLYATYCPLSRFAGTEMYVLMSYCRQNCAIFVCFKDSNGCKITYTVYPPYTFLPKSALIIGEAPTHGCVDHRFLLFYPLPDYSLNVGFAVEGSANVKYACVYTFRYKTDAPMILCKLNNGLYYAFEWTSNCNSYSAKAYTSCICSIICGTIHLGYTECPPTCSAL
jgi:hypothetical protein